MDILSKRNVLITLALAGLVCIFLPIPKPEVKDDGGPTERSQTPFERYNVEYTEFYNTHGDIIASGDGVTITEDNIEFVAAWVDGDYRPVDRSIKFHPKEGIRIARVYDKILKSDIDGSIWWVKNNYG